LNCRPRHHFPNKNARRSLACRRITCKRRDYGSHLSQTAQAGSRACRRRRGRLGDIMKPIPMKLIRISARDRRMAAIHEAGHIVMARKLGLPLSSAWIVPNGDGGLEENFWTGRVRLALWHTTTKPTKRRRRMSASPVPSRNCPGEGNLTTSTIWMVPRLVVGPGSNRQSARRASRGGGVVLCRGGALDLPNQTSLPSSIAAGAAATAE
jgi:hypothetical protein